MSGIAPVIALTLCGEQARLRPPRRCGIIEVPARNSMQDSEPEEGSRRVSLECPGALNREHIEHPRLSHL
jgi:hypothetical protein